MDGVEQCDGKDLGGKKNCTTIAPGTTGPLGCTKDCTFDTSQCVATKCGDGKVEGAEECDGTLDPSVTCSDLLGANYASDEKPYCSSKCKVDYLSCKPLDGHIGPPLLPMELGGIQATEVTRAQYAQFLQATQGMALPTPPECGGNSTMPNTSCLQDATVCNEPGTACARHPQVCVDFCDAKAFCAFGGRHVCGGPGGTPIGLNAGFSSDDLWFNACASGGAYFYGEEFEPGRCNTAESGIGSTVPVGSLAQCRSGYAPYSSIADMFGNVDEWENSSCQLNVIGQLVCAVRGNSFLEPHSAGGCFGAYRLEGIVTTLPSVGFRCCD